MIQNMQKESEATQPDTKGQ